MLMTSGIIKMLAQLLVILIYARILSVEDYGYYQSIWLYSGILGVISLFGLPLMILSVGFGNLKEYAKKHKQKVTLVASVLFVIPVAILFLLEPGLHLLSKLLIVLFTISQNIAAIRECIVLKAEGHQRVLLANIIFTALFLVVHILLAEDFNLNYLLLGLTFCFIIKTSFLSKPVIDETQFTEWKPGISLGKQWLYLGLFDVVNVIYKWLDKWVILYFITVSQFAMYYNGSYEIPVFGLMVSAAGNILLIEWSKEKVTATRVRELMHQSASFLSILVLPAFAFLVVNYENVFLLIFGEKYRPATEIFFVALFILPLRAVNFTAPLQSLHKNNIILSGAILDIIIAIILMIILYPIYGMIGIILSIVIATWTQAIYYVIMISKFGQISLNKLLPYGRMTLITAVSFGLTLATWWLTKDFSTLVQLTAGAGCAAIIIGVLFWKQVKKTS